MQPITAPLYGLVLAGGDSRRMGRDKGALEWQGEPLAVRQWRLLSALCERAFVSVNATQVAREPYRDLPLIHDPQVRQGPITGLLAASQAHAEVAWLVVAVDMPRVDDVLLGELIAARDPARDATAFVHAEGLVEPLCAIWEPSAFPVLRGELHRGRASPRRFLEARDVVRVPIGDSAPLRSVNDARDWPMGRPP